MYRDARCVRCEEWRWRKQSLSGELSFQRLLEPEMFGALKALGEEMPLGFTIENPSKPIENLYFYMNLGYF